MMKEWVLPENARTKEVLEWVNAHEHPDRLLLMARLKPSERGLFPTEPASIANAFRLLDDDLIHTFVASGWPVTKLMETLALVFVARVSRPLIARLSAACDSFFGWLYDHEPPLPEDLCLFREGAEFPFLVSTTHEGDGWVFSDKEVEIPGVKQEEFPGNLTDWLGDPKNYFLQGGRPVLSSPQEIAEGIIRF